MRFVLVLLGVTLAACDATDPASALAAARPERTPVCHYDVAADTYTLLSLVAPAAAAHTRNHARDYAGVDYEGASVPGLEGHVFDAACQPVPFATTISACLAEAIENFNDVGLLNTLGPFPEDPSTLSPWAGTATVVLHTAPDATEYRMSITEDVDSLGAHRCWVGKKVSGGTTGSSSSTEYADPTSTEGYFNYLRSL